MLNRVLTFGGSSPLYLNEIHTNSIATIAPNLDDLFDNDMLKSLLTILITRNIVRAEYQKKLGFFYSLSEVGEELSEGLSGEYFLEVKRFCKAMNQLQPKSISQLNSFINKYLKMD